MRNKVYCSAGLFNTVKGSQSGFTLIEIIIGIVVMSLSLSMITSALLPANKHSAGQVQQIRAAELGQSMMNEILAKAFDHHSNFTGGIERCGEGTACSTIMGPETISAVVENRENYNDVDDYQGLSLLGSAIENSLGQALGDIYLGFTVSIEVCNDSNLDGDCATSVNDFTAKKITITVLTPQQDRLVFATYKANY